MIRLVASLAFVLGMLGLALPAPAAADPGEGPQAKPRELRVMTYNIHHGSGNDACVPTAQPPSPAPNLPECSLDLDRIAGIIRASGAEVVALQEIDRLWTRSHITDQPALLAATLGMNHCYGANLVHEPDRHSAVSHEYGTLILSRFPILECRNTLLPQTVSPARERRGLLEVLVNVRGVHLRVYDTHLDPSNDAERVAQVAAIMAQVGAFKEPTVLMGDLNAQPSRPEVLTLRTVFDDAWLGALTVDQATPTAPTRSPRPTRASTTS